MARSLNEIKAEIATAFISQEVVRNAYGLDDNATFDKVFSPVSIESILFDVVASCIWVVESLFDRHKLEVETRIEALRPHTLRWYVSKTLEYMHGKSLKPVSKDGVVIADYYDTKDMPESEIEKKRIVKYAVATESNTHVLIKAAGSNDGRPKKLNAEQLNGLSWYLSQIKDAGVNLRVISEDADQMNVELYVRYDPTVLQAEFLTDKENEYLATENTFYTNADRASGYHLIRLSPIDDVQTDILDNVVCDVITHLPFNGEYRNSDLLAAIQSINGIEVADICKVEVCAASATGVYTPVVGYRRPYSGYYELTNLVVKGKPYITAE